MKYFILFLCLASPLLIVSCQYQNEEELYAICDTTNATFSGTVLPIIQAHCYSCHSDANNATSGQGIKLEGYENIKMKIDQGMVLCNIRHENGCIPMPYNRPKLKECDINKIGAWIKRGYPNN